MVQRQPRHPNTLSAADPRTALQWLLSFRTVIPQETVIRNLLVDEEATSNLLRRERNEYVFFASSPSPFNGEADQRQRGCEGTNSGL